MDEAKVRLDFLSHAIVLGLEHREHAIGGLQQPTQTSQAGDEFRREQQCEHKQGKIVPGLQGSTPQTGILTIQSTNINTTTTGSEAHDINETTVVVVALVVVALVVVGCVVLGPGGTPFFDKSLHQKGHNSNNQQSGVLP